MRCLYSLLIYATMILAVATVWAIGHEFHEEAALARARERAAVPQFESDSAPDEPIVVAAAPRDTPATRPSPPGAQPPSSDAPEPCTPNSPDSSGNPDPRVGTLNRP
jgi:hypothetical protein